MTMSATYEKNDILWNCYLF